jgi:hypothetical protein
MEGRNTRFAALGVFAMLALLAVASPSSAQCVGPGPTGGTSAIVAPPGDDPSTSADVPLLLRAASLRYPMFGLLGSFWGRTPASVAASSRVVAPGDSRTTRLVSLARTKAGRL